MSQIFPRSANALARASVFVALFLAAAGGYALWTLAHSGYVTRQGIVLPQPVPFSHDHHVAQIGIDCRYCHTSVERAASAGIPPTQTCMNCHNQIWTNAAVLEPVRASWRDGKPLSWNRVNDLPDFVYFNHSIHIKKGMGCETCHGRVDKMPLMRQQNTLQMEWCLNCHRNPEQFVRPRSEVFTMGYVPAVDQRELGPQLVAEYKIQSLTNCSVCHR